jgi:hypothetical protein
MSLRIRLAADREGPTGMVRGFPKARCRSPSQQLDGWIVVDVATERVSSGGLCGNAVMINLIDESTKITLTVEVLGPIPATSLLDDKGGSPLFRTARAMPTDYKNSLVTRQTPIPWRMTLLPSCR